MYRVYYTCCRKCNTKLLPSDDSCPQCGVPCPESTDDPFAVRTLDVILSVMLAAATLGLTVLINIPAAQLLMGGFWRFDLGTFIFTGIWNFGIVGLPLLFLVHRWYSRVRDGVFHHATAWHDYWTLQLLALSPILVITGCIAAATLVASYVAKLTSP